MFVKSLVALLLVTGTLVGAQDPEWYARIKAEDTTGLVKRCFKKTARGVVPNDGDGCARRPKTCYFGTQTCPNVGAHPTTKCVCEDRTWDCEPEVCAISGCRDASECLAQIPPLEVGEQICVAADDCYNDFCTLERNCSDDADCAGEGEVADQVCDDRGELCRSFCTSARTFCNAPCTADAECGLGRSCSLPDGHCVATTCTADSDCVDHYACTGGTCGRRTCSGDPGCAADAGFCVKGKCQADLGNCAFPPGR